MASLLPVWLRDRQAEPPPPPPPAQPLRTTPAKTDEELLRAELLAIATRLDEIATALEPVASYDSKHPKRPLYASVKTSLGSAVFSLRSACGHLL